ncbi:NAD-dependent epimerase/dehydratase family protein [Variovorax robiniae]|uniref:NAD-dependent epimerase/dehydratase family protein n=1 Tax=Variovorax robiniae TaxID=1836199 RepID=A0ABU8X0D2_9BURK
MKRVVITGAHGFIGQVLVRRLLEQGIAGAPIDQLTLVDLSFDRPHDDPRVDQVEGSLDDAAVLERACASPMEAVFHLASLPGGAAERDYALGRRINLDATLRLIEMLRHQPSPPRFVFASSIAVYGENLPELIDESTLPAPALTYGVHKLAGEVLVADATRRGWIEGCSLRLPGVVARPGEGVGLMSAFMSQMFWRLAAGEQVTLPVSADGVAWWISARACVGNLVHAAEIRPELLDARRSYQMPVLRLTMDQVVQALAARYGVERAALVRYAPEPLVQRLFASYPPLHTPAAEALGFRHDGTVQQLIEQAMLS